LKRLEKIKHGKARQSRTRQAHGIARQVDKVQQGMASRDKGKMVRSAVRKNEAMIRQEGRL
jgi:hypothetical protein